MQDDFLPGIFKNKLHSASARAERPLLRSTELIGSQADCEASDVASGLSVNNREKVPISKGLRRHSGLGISLLLWSVDFLLIELRVLLAWAPACSWAKKARLSSS